MWLLYLDESGDLGFDFVNKRPSNHFTITMRLCTYLKNKNERAFWACFSGAITHQIEGNTPETQNGLTAHL